MAWAVSGNLKGPQGDQGIQGIKGDTGADGQGIAIAGSVATYSALPTGLTSADAGNGYLVQADGLLYIWDGDSFPADGSGVQFKGPKGDQGDAGTAATITVNSTTTGAAGSSAAVSNSGTATAVKLDFTIPAGDKGNTGGTGTPGSDGRDGNRWFNGTGAPGTVAGAVAGDYYLDTTSGDVYLLS